MYLHVWTGFGWKDHVGVCLFGQDHGTKTTCMGIGLDVKGAFVNVPNLLQELRNSFATKSLGTTRAVDREIQKCSVFSIGRRSGSK